MPTIRLRVDRRRDARPRASHGIVRSALIAMLAALGFVALPGVASAAATNGRIAFASDRTGDLEIYSMNPDGTGQAQLTNSPGDDSFPSWSKNGASIAFQSMRTGIGCPAIFLMNGDGTSQAQVTSGHCDQEPTWDPTSTQIAFTRDLGTDVEIFRINAHVNGTGLVQLTNTPGSFNVDPTWGLNNKIVFTSNRDGNEEIYSMNADGTGQTRLTNDQANDYGPYWSPDGSKIVFQSERDGNSEIYVMNADGTGQTRLTNNPAVDSSPAWSPDGSQIAFHSDRNGNFDVFTMDATTGDARGLFPPTDLTNNPALDKFPDWQPRSGGGGAHPTSTSVTCSPGTVAVGQATTCTAMVTDTVSGGQTTPTGTVAFTSSRPGSFSGSPCTLTSSGASASCSVTYAPGASGTPTRADTITATYGGDSTHDGSSGSTSVTVRPTSKQACRHRGYLNYGFTRQRQCIRWVKQNP